MSKIDELELKTKQQERVFGEFSGADVSCEELLDLIAYVRAAEAFTHSLISAKLQLSVKDALYLQPVLRQFQEARRTLGLET